MRAFDISINVNFWCLPVQTYTHTHTRSIKWDGWCDNSSVDAVANSSRNHSSAVRSSTFVSLSVLRIGLRFLVWEKSTNAKLICALMLPNIFYKLTRAIPFWKCSYAAIWLSSFIYARLCVSLRVALEHIVQMLWLYVHVDVCVCGNVRATRSLDDCPN